MGQIKQMTVLHRKTSVENKACKISVPRMSHCMAIYFLAILSSGVLACSACRRIFAEGERMLRAFSLRGYSVVPLDRVATQRH